MAVSCVHLDFIRPVPPGGDVCPSCLEFGGTWVDLRQCMTCGQVGCCDSSPNTHATRHYRTSGHPIIRSIMPAQDWLWCYESQVAFRREGDGFVDV